MSGKFRVAAAAMALLIGSSSIAVAQSDTTKTDLSGNWSFTVVYEGGQGSPTVRLVQKGDTLTGRYISQAFGELDLKGEIHGKEFYFSLTTSAGGDPFTMTFEGVVESADALKGSVELGGNGNATFTARRQKQDPSGLTPAGSWIARVRTVPRLPASYFDQRDSDFNASTSASTKHRCLPATRCATAKTRS